MLNQQLHSIGGKGLFTKELDMALLNKEVISFLYVKWWQSLDRAMVITG